MRKDIDAVIAVELDPIRPKVKLRPLAVIKGQAMGVRRFTLKSHRASQCRNTPRPGLP